HLEVGVPEARLASQGPNYHLHGQLSFQRRPTHLAHPLHGGQAVLPVGAAQGGQGVLREDGRRPLLHLLLPQGRLPCHRVDQMNSAENLLGSMRCRPSWRRAYDCSRREGGHGCARFGGGRSRLPLRRLWLRLRLRLRLGRGNCGDLAGSLASRRRNNLRLLATLFHLEKLSASSLCYKGVEPAISRQGPTLSILKESRSARNGATARSPTTFMAVPRARAEGSRTVGSESFSVFSREEHRAFSSFLFRAAGVERANTRARKAAHSAFTCGW
ncbi:unnamed protein product, partial [Ixodes pacificus]